MAPNCNKKWPFCKIQCEKSGFLKIGGYHKLELNFWLFFVTKKNVKLDKFVKQYLTPTEELAFFIDKNISMYYAVS
jgi:hypothetical protein